MPEKTCAKCDNRICKDMLPTMQKKYITLCLNSNRSRFIQHKDKEKAMRLIDADKADVERISCFYDSEFRLQDVQEWLDEQPTVNTHECNLDNNTVCISKEEYKELLEYKAMYEDLCK